MFVPLMVIAIGLSMKLAAPTSQFILMFTAASGMIVHSLMGHPNYLEAGLLSVGSFLGGLVGSKLSTRVNERKLRLFVTIILGISALKLVLDALAGPF